MGSGKKTGCTVRAATCTIMVSHIKAVSTTTASTATACIVGLTVANTMANGSMANSMVELSTPTVKECFAKVFGRKENDSSGSMKVQFKKSITYRKKMMKTTRVAASEPNEESNK